MEKITIELVPENNIGFIEHWCNNHSCPMSKHYSTGKSLLIPFTQFDGRLQLCDSCKKVMHTLPYREAYIEYLLSKKS